MPLNVWTCDACCNPIEDTGQALVVWKLDSAARKYGFRIVHKGPKCDFDRDMQSWELSDLLGIDGQAVLLAWLSYGPLKSEGARPQVRDTDEYVDLFRRLHTPWYEEARPFFGDENVAERFGDANEAYPYQEHVLQQIAEEGDRRR